MHMSPASQRPYRKAACQFSYRFKMLSVLKYVTYIPDIKINVDMYGYILP